MGRKKSIVWHSHERLVWSLLSAAFSLSFPVQFLSARLLVCSELQIGPRSFIQNQMRVWQPLHLRHFSAHQLRLGKSPTISSHIRACLVWFFGQRIFKNVCSNVRCVWLRCSGECYCSLLVVFAVAVAAARSLFVSVQVPLIGEHAAYLFLLLLFFHYNY